SALLEWRDERFGEGLIILPRLNETRFNPERSQMVTSISAQLLTPIVSERNRRFGVHEFELQLAGRFDEYTTHGVTGLVSSLTPVTVARVRNTARSTEPTVAIRYRPVADVTIRASFGTGFLPPGVHQLIPSPPNFTANFFDPRRGNTRPGLVSNVTGGNPALQPERSESRSAGIIVMPHVLPGFRLSVDYTRINKKDNIAGFNFQQTVDNEALLPNRVQRGPNLPGDPPGWPGPITFIDATSLNISQAEVEAYDLQLDYDRPTATLGTFSFLAMATWQTHYKTQVISSSPIVENVGYFYSNPLKLKGNLGLTWRRGALTLGWRARYFDGYRVYLPTASAAAKAALVLSQGSEEVSSQIYHDLFWSYRFGGKGSSTARRILSGTELSGGFRNIFNRMPAYDASQSVTGYYSFLGDPRMASYYLSVKRSF
ncbi:MAG: TonB-dependent receptor, partial [Opitutaceae bacterium]